MFTGFQIEKNSKSNNILNMLNNYFSKNKYIKVFSHCTRKHIHKVISLLSTYSKEHY